MYFNEPSSFSAQVRRNLTEIWNRGWEKKKKEFSKKLLVDLSVRKFLRRTCQTEQLKSNGSENVVDGLMHVHAHKPIYTHRMQIISLHLLR